MFNPPSSDEFQDLLTKNHITDNKMQLNITKEEWKKLAESPDQILTFIKDKASKLVSVSEKNIQPNNNL